MRVRDVSRVDGISRAVMCSRDLTGGRETSRCRTAITAVTAVAAVTASAASAASHDGVPITELTAPITAVTSPITAITAPITAITEPITAVTAPVTAVTAPNTAITAGAAPALRSRRRSRKSSPSSVVNTQGRESGGSGFETARERA